MPYINHMNIIIGRPINRFIDVANYVLIILCYVILDIYYYQGFFCMVSPPDRQINLFSFLLYHVIVDNIMATIYSDNKEF